MCKARLADDAQRETQEFARKVQDVVAMDFIKQLEKSLQLKADECKRIYTGVIKAKDKFYREVKENGESGKGMEAIVYVS